MRLSHTARWGLAALATSALLGGCTTTIDGKPIAHPKPEHTEPSFPTPRPTTSAPPTSESPTPSTLSPGPTTPAGAIPLPPDENGYVFIETKSGLTRCQINKDSVGCEAPFKNSPMQDGERTNGVHITSSGKVEWVLGNLGAIPTVTIDYKVYDAAGWTINATEEGTNFKNNATGHGMFVSVEKVSTF